MNANSKWPLITLACTIVAVGATWYFVKKDGAAPLQSGPSVKNEETVQLIVAFSKSLMLNYAHESDSESVTKLLFDSSLKTVGGKRIEIKYVSLSSRQIIDGVLNGSLKAQVIVPSSEVFLELADRESKLKTGKPLLGEKTVFMRQPLVIAIRRPMAEAMGWPGKDLGWADVLEIARNGWKTAGHPEWGSLRLVLGNPNLSDAGMHATVSASLAILGNSKGLNEEDFRSPALVEATKALDGAVVWYPPSIEEFVRNEVMGVPPHCHMAVLPEHLLRTLNDRSIRRKTQADWVAIYPVKGAIVDDVAAATVQRDWVSDEQREVATMALKQLRSPEVQKRLLALGHRPVMPNLPLADHLTSAMGVDSTRPRESAQTPDAEIVLDCVSAWNDGWKSKHVGAAATTGSAHTATASAPLSLQKFTSLSPTIQCIRRARPSTIVIKDAATKEVRGSGVVVDPRGYAITNHHVVGKEKVVAVSFIETNDKIYKGDVIWSDSNQDLAIVRIDHPGKFPAIKYGDSSVREVGETVVAIGNPLGYTGTVTVGIVSALGRDITLPTGAILTKVIQTDAGINPGNSGGPLLDIDGQLIGIVFAVRNGAQNIAFAIPLERVQTSVKTHIPD